MLMPPLSLLIAVGLAAAGALLLVAAVRALLRWRLLRTTLHLTLAALLLASAALLGTLSVAVQGYRAFTHEELAATVLTEPLGPQRFRAHLEFPDGRTASFVLAGEELYVDARVLKWKPVANFFGLHTSYELDRIAGRYADLEAERTRPRTVYALGQAKPADVFDLRRRYALLSPLLDAEYGSASFAGVEGARRLEVRVSTSGLLIRPKD